MRKFFTPHKKAILIAWSILAAWCLTMYVAIGPDWWVPSLYPAFLVLVMTGLIVRWERRIFRTSEDHHR